MKIQIKNKLIVFLLLGNVWLVFADVDVAHQQPEVLDIHNKLPLKKVVQDVRLAPEPNGIGGEGSYLGHTVSIDGNRALVGSDENMGGRGAVFVMEFDGVNWHEVSVLKPNNNDESTYFGSSVSLFGNRALVGAYLENANGTSGSGSVYVYDFDGVNWIQSSKLTAPDVLPFLGFGKTVSLFTDRALISASGVVYVFDYDGVQWVFRSRLTTSDITTGSSFGRSLSVFGDIAIVGAHSDDENGVNSGSVYIYKYDGMNWSQSIKLMPVDGDDDNFGRAVSLEDNRALIGAPGDNSVFVYDYDGINWIQNIKLTATDGDMSDQFGFSVSLSGGRALVGAFGDDDNGNGSGSVYVFEFDGMNWSQNYKLTASDGKAHEWFGYSVSLSGNNFLVGAKKDNDNGTNSGSAYFYGYENMNWTEKYKLLKDGAAFDFFGFSVSRWGNRALVGAPHDYFNTTDLGAAYVFEFDGENWISSGKLMASDGAVGDEFGSSVSLSGDRALIGACGDDDNGRDSGSAYIFEYDGTNWSQADKIISNDGTLVDRFGCSVSIFGDRVLVGAYHDDDNGDNSGSAYVFEFDGMNWSQSIKLMPVDGDDDDNFGRAVSLEDNRVLIGAPGNSSVYVYDYDGINWTQSEKLIATDSDPSDGFGLSVSLSGNRALVGAYGDDDNGSASGSAYLYENNGMNWIQSAKLKPKDGNANDFFGVSVSLSVGRALIGASGDDDNGNESGSAYLYEYNGMNWNQSVKLKPNDGVIGDDFGSSVSLYGSKILVGAEGNDENGKSSGAAYILDIDYIFKNDFDSNNNQRDVEW